MSFGAACEGDRRIEGGWVEADGAARGTCPVQRKLACVQPEGVAKIYAPSDHASAAQVQYDKLYIGSSRSSIDLRLIA